MLSAGEYLGAMPVHEEAAPRVSFYSVNSPWGLPQPGLLHVVDLGGGCKFHHVCALFICLYRCVCVRAGGHIESLSFTGNQTSDQAEGKGGASCTA